MRPVNKTSTGVKQLIFCNILHYGTWSMVIINLRSKQNEQKEKCERVTYSTIQYTPTLPTERIVGSISLYTFYHNGFQCSGFVNIVHPDPGIHRSELRIQIQIREANLLQIRSEPDINWTFCGH